MKRADLIFSKNLVDYKYALDFMKNRVNDIIDKKANETIWFLEHNHLYTAGRSANNSELLTKSIPIFYTDRGGKFTYHGPGQRVIYVMLNLKNLFDGKPDIKIFVKMLEKWIITTLAELSITGETRKDRIGVWVRNNNTEKKIAAIGIKVRKWITFHGIAININPDLRFYDGIIPCGIKDYGITSVSKLCKTDLNIVDKILIDQFCKTFNYSIITNHHEI